MSEETKEYKVKKNKNNEDILNDLRTVQLRLDFARENVTNMQERLKESDVSDDDMHLLFRSLGFINDANRFINSIMHDYWMRRHQLQIKSINISVDTKTDPAEHKEAMDEFFGQVIKNRLEKLTKK